MAGWEAEFLGDDTSVRNPMTTKPLGTPRISLPDVLLSQRRGVRGPTRAAPPTDLGSHMGIGLAGLAEPWDPLRATCELVNAGRELAQHVVPDIADEVSEAAYRRLRRNGMGTTRAAVLAGGLGLAVGVFGLSMYELFASSLGCA